MSKDRVPKSVKKAEAQAEEVHRAMYGLPQDTQEEGEQKGDDAQAEGADDQALDDPKQGEPQETDPKPQAQNEPKPDQGDEWKRKYESLRGKYDAEIPRLAADLRELRKEKQEMERQLQELQQSNGSAPGSGDTDNIDEAVKKLSEEYGEEFYDLLRKVAKNEAAGDLQSIRQELNDLKQDRAMSKRERFEQDLNSAVPDWEAINIKPEFHTWLAETDPFTGEVRQLLLDRAAAALDAKRVTAIFQAFKGPEPQSNEPPKKDTRSVSPPRGRGAEPPPQKPRYTTADWNQLQEEYRRGKWKHRLKEFHEKEEAIHKALTRQT